MNIDITSTIVGHNENGYWMFSGIMAERIHKLTGLRLVKSFGGVLRAGFPSKDECLYTPRLVRAGYKVCIIS